MPVFIFDNTKLIVAFKSAFEADMHECKFNPKFWRRVQIVGAEEEDGSKRGTAFVSRCDEPMAAFAKVSIFFD